MGSSGYHRTGWVALIDGPGPLREAMKQTLQAILPFEIRALPQDPTKPVEGMVGYLQRHHEGIVAAIIHATAWVGKQGLPCPQNGLSVMRMVAKQHLCKVVLFELEPLVALRAAEVPALPDERFLHDYDYSFFSPPLSVVEIARAIF